MASSASAEAKGHVPTTGASKRRPRSGGEGDERPAVAATTEARDVHGTVDTSVGTVTAVLTAGLEQQKWPSDQKVAMTEAAVRAFAETIAKGITDIAKLCTCAVGKDWVSKHDSAGTWSDDVVTRVNLLASSALHGRGQSPLTAKAAVRKIAEHNAVEENRIRSAGIGVGKQPHKIGDIAMRAADKNVDLAMFYLDPGKRCVVVRTDLRGGASGTTSLTQLHARTVEPSRFKPSYISGGSGPDRADPVIQMVVGSSGAGKTSRMLTAREDDTETLVCFFFSAADIATKVRDTTAGKKAAKMRAWRRLVDVQSGLTDADRADRNGAVLDAVTAMLASVVSGLAGDSRLETTGPDDKLRVRVAIDEAGPFHGLTRAVIAQRATIHKLVRDQCQLRAAVPVDIMIGGTGSGSPAESFGSAAYEREYDVINMDDDTRREEFANHFKLPAAVEAVLFDRNNPATSESSTAAVKELLSNPRMGALIEKGLRSTENREKRGRAFQWPPVNDVGRRDRATSLNALMDCTQTVIKDAVQWFVCMNAMVRLTEEQLQSVLADAMSIDVCGFDSISDAAISPALAKYVDAERDRSSVVPKRNVLHYLLVTKFGVLHDRARPVSPAISRRLRVAKGADALYVPDDGKGRYVVPAAYRVMFTGWCMDRLPRVHGGADSDGLERLLWQWGAALQLCVPKQASLGQLVEQMLHGAIVLPADAARAPPSPLGRGKAFKGRLVAAPCLTHGTLGKGSERLTGSGEVHLLAARNKCPCEWKAGGETVKSCELLQPAAEGGVSCMSVLNAASASCADTMHHSARREAVANAAAKDKQTAAATRKAAAAAAATVVKRERVQIRAKLYPKSPVSEDQLKEEFSNMRKNVGPGDVCMNVFFAVTSKRASVDQCEAYVAEHPRRSDGGRVEEVVCIIPCDENATIDPGTPLPAAFSGFALTYPVLYPLAVGRLSTWTVDGADGR